MMLARGLVAVAFVMFFVSLVFQSVPAAVGGVAVAFLAFVLKGSVDETHSS
jgi:hypothetical protein